MTPKFTRITGQIRTTGDDLHSPSTHAWSMGIILELLKAEGYMPSAAKLPGWEFDLHIAVLDRHRRNLEQDWDLYRVLECLGERLNVYVEAVFNGNESEREIRRPHIPSDKNQGRIRFWFFTAESYVISR